MDIMDIYALVWRMNLHTPCLDKATMTRFTHLTASIISEVERRFNKKQATDIILAMMTSASWHKGYYRKDETTPYIVHPFEVVELLFACGLYDYKLTIAAILHDVVEDEEEKVRRYRKRQFITRHFGGGVRDVVELVTKSRRPHKRALFFTRLLAEKRVATAVRAGLLKLADCAKNSETFDVFKDKEKITRKVAEVKKEYPPLFAKTLENIKKLSVSEKKKTFLSGVARQLFGSILINISKYE